jgi:hypothetical protein
MQCLTHGKTLNVPSSAKAIIDSLDGYECFITEDVKKAAEITIDRINEYNTPADRNWLKGAIFTLLQHYYVRELDEDVQRAIAQDWIDILSKYPQWAIEKARAKYLTEFDRKPVPKNIVDLCNKEMAKTNKLYFKCKEILRLPLSREVKQVSQDERDKAIADVQELLKNLKNN